MPIYARWPKAVAAFQVIIFHFTLGFHPQTIGWDLDNLGNWSGTDGYSRFTDFDGDEKVDYGEYCGAWHG